MDSTPAYLKGRGRGRGRGAGSNPQQNTGKPGFSSSVGPSSGKSALPVNVNENNSIKMATERFAEVSAKIQQSVQRHLDEMDDNGFSSDEEEDIGDNVLNKVFQTYSNNFEEKESVDIDRAQEYLLHSFRSGSSACVICIETIKKEDAIWTCSGCCCMFHMQCIQKWVREGVYIQKYQAGDDASTDNIPWHCPKCRHEYEPSACPTKYFCFCGKVQDPKFDPWLVPHSCGQTCNTRLRPDCGHSCLLLCHPGPCPPCPKLVKSTCYCGKQAPQMRRCSARTWACGQPCGKELSCRHHKCQQPCHPGECAACPKTSEQKCLCGRQKTLRPCASPGWQCDQPCGRTLQCGNHICETLCHTGKCGACPRSGKRSCPCGKTEYSLPCTEDIPTCGDTCGKVLACGRHACTQRCHLGSCGPCLQVAQKCCRCGQRQKEVPCSKEYLCDIKCTNYRDCGKHQCKRKCCDGNCPPCEQICGKNLGCRNHKCASRCHRGTCYPCPLTVDISCFCKATTITVPCGREKSTKPPRCNKKCKNPSACHHPLRVPHRCHFDECPTCRQTCSLQLPKCQHICPAACHDVVKIKVQDNTPRAGPWDGRPRTVVETVKQPCPACKVPLPVECKGGHETSMVECSKVEKYSCGRKCGRELVCGNHSCSLDCHAVTNAANNHVAGSNCQHCERPCVKRRPEGCTHKCLKSCHPGACLPCTSRIRMRCHCGAMVKHVVCSEWTSASADRKNSIKSCGNCSKMLPCGHQCGFACHPGQCPGTDKCQKKVTLRCKCRRKKTEGICCDVKNGSDRLECDEICKRAETEKKKLEEKAEIAKKEEEVRRQKEELEAFERMTKGRRRKPRKHHQDIVEETFWQKHRKLVSIAVTAIAAIVVSGLVFHFKLF
ncbi:NF-X1-type zinc finger protein NFXL1-like [Gigantopelta aegis]|uniref:NF-X1-type zinc finger protein NFXL1-like n=1 Tax=Gigantopelta aegis TaxID=1735272 RepID=UPI001B88C9FE|nr:NF-X1-type zinc finger protein NFXL1-like [Gigantopelta aegis]